MAMRCDVDIEEAIRGLKEINEDSSKMMKAFMGELRRRAPTWIAKGISEDYGISAAEAKANSSMQVSGSGFDSLVLHYQGRRLTPIHFKMTPKQPSSLLDRRRLVPGAGINLASGGKSEVAQVRARKSYQVSARIKKAKKPLGNGKTIFLAPAAKSSGKMIPYKRTPAGPYETDAIHTLSVPQMIKDGQGNLKPAVERQLNTNIEKRFNHYVQRYLGM